MKEVVEEGDEVREGAGVEREEEEEEQLHFLVRLLWEELELQVCALGEAVMWAEGAWGSPVWESLIPLAQELLVLL